MAVLSNELGKFLKIQQSVSTNQFLYTLPCSSLHELPEPQALDGHALCDRAAASSGPHDWKNISQCLASPNQQCQQLQSGGVT